MHPAGRSLARTTDESSNIHAGFGGGIAEDVHRLVLLLLELLSDACIKADMTQYLLQEEVLLQGSRSSAKEAKDVVGDEPQGQASFKILAFAVMLLMRSCLQQLLSRNRCWCPGCRSAKPKLFKVWEPSAPKPLFLLMKCSMASMCLGFGSRRRRSPLLRAHNTRRPGELRPRAKGHCLAEWLLAGMMHVILGGHWHLWRDGSQEELVNLLRQEVDDSLLHPVCRHLGLHVVVSLAANPL